MSAEELDWEMEEYDPQERMRSATKVSLAFSTGFIAGMQLFPLPLATSVISRYAPVFKVSPKRFQVLSAVFVGGTAFLGALGLAYPVYRLEKETLERSRVETRLATKPFALSSEESFERRAVAIKQQLKRYS